MITICRPVRLRFLHTELYDYARFALTVVGFVWAEMLVHSMFFFIFFRWRHSTSHSWIVCATFIFFLRSSKSRCFVFLFLSEWLRCLIYFKQTYLCSWFVRMGWITLYIVSQICKESSIFCFISYRVLKKTTTKESTWNHRTSFSYYFTRWLLMLISMNFDLSLTELNHVS